MTTFTVFHADHDINDDQMDYIKQQLQDQADGFFIRQINIPDYMGTVPCGLYGPAMGDDPIGDDMITMKKRSEDRPADRMIDMPFRQVGYVQVIGIRDGQEFKLFTVYGGPLAPQNPEDPTCQDRDASLAFWSQHALVG